MATAGKIKKVKKTATDKVETNLVRRLTVKPKPHSVLPFFLITFGPESL